MGECVVRETFLWGLSQARELCMAWTVGWYTHWWRRGPKLARCLFLTTQKEVSHSFPYLSPPTLPPSPHRALGVYTLLPAIVLSSSVEVPRLSNCHGCLAQVSCSTGPGHPRGRSTPVRWCKHTPGAVEPWPALDIWSAHSGLFAQCL